MRFTVARNSSRRYYYAFIAFACIALYLVWSSAAVSAQQTTVAATVCESASSITLTQPASDSTAMDASIPIAGTVKQANQIEIYVDDAFDSVMPLTVGQTSFNGSVQISQGTHTIKVVAINICPGPNGSDSSVITFELPPNTSGGGTGTDTTTGEQPEIPVSSEDDVLPVLPFVPREATQVFEGVGQWLNIAATYEAPATPRLTLIRATTIAVGSWLLAFGIATTVVQWLGSAIPLFANVPSTKRSRIISWMIRGIGLLMVLGGLFL